MFMFYPRSVLLRFCHADFALIICRAMPAYLFTIAIVSCHE